MWGVAAARRVAEQLILRNSGPGARAGKRSSHSNFINDREPLLPTLPGADEEQPCQIVCVIVEDATVFTSARRPKLKTCRLRSIKNGWFALGPKNVHQPWSLAP